MSGSLDGVLEATRVREQRRAARALLRRPLLRAHGSGSDDFPLVRRHAGVLRSWFDLNTGWRLIVDTEGARLLKRTPATTDATHPARDPRSGRPFERRRYVLACLALAVLERAEAQITLGQLAEGIILAAADEDLVAAGVEFRLEGRDERADLVSVVRLLLALGVIERVAGDEDAYVRDAGDALYDVQRRALAGMLSAPRDLGTFPDWLIGDDVPAGLHADDGADPCLRRAGRAQRQSGRRLDGHRHADQTDADRAPDGAERHGARRGGAGLVNRMLRHPPTRVNADNPPRSAAGRGRRRLT